ncbi:zf-HC2 domain-containing protein [Alkalihalobacterium bogoriense]|uniref:zf-HC2 domain-containing protein n=1 Tax=Alkalihalobacterium bogoriense TaxID=246272 RepID=UPI00047BD5E2|nr:zf-HC2 domain-containing protein [Alkalihalobacterium bogoriense]
MKEIKCTIIQDVLPLYIDGVVSHDTKEMVDIHLKTCENCRKEYESMKQELYIPVDNQTSPIKNMKRKWRNKKFIVSLVSVFVTAILLYGAFAAAVYIETVIPYSDDLIRIEKLDNNQLVSIYTGESYAAVHTTHPFPIEINGEIQHISFMYYTKSFAESPTRDLFNLNKNHKQEYIFPIPEFTKADAVYYVKYDTFAVSGGKETWPSILKRGELIWEKK